MEEKERERESCNMIFIVSEVRERSEMKKELLIEFFVVEENRIFPPSCYKRRGDHLKEDDDGVKRRRG